MPLPEDLKELVRGRTGTCLRDWMQEQADEINSALEKIVDIHLLAPPPDKPLKIEPISFDQPKPQPPEKEKVGLIRGLFSPEMKHRTEEDNDRRYSAYLKASKLWDKLRHLNDRKELRRVEKIK